MEQKQRTRSTLVDLSLILVSALLACLAIAFSAEAASVDPTPSETPSRIVLNPTAQPMTSQSVTWRTDAAVASGVAEVTPVAGGATVTVPAETGSEVSFEGWTYSSRHHTALFTGLTPDTEYRYRVGNDPDWSEWKTFRTAASEFAPWQMLYFGDAQNGLDTVWPDVAGRAFSSVPEAKVHLHAGDLINNSDNDVQWGDWFAALDGNSDRLMTLPVAGNHERSGDPLFTQFSQHFETPGNGPALARDTVYYVDYQDVRFIVLDGNGTDALGQQAFLRAALSDNPNRWTVVAFHQPLFSGAVGRDNPLNRMLILPILEEFNVDLVLQGHDHVYARGHVTANETQVPGVQTGPVYVVSVAGSKYYELSPADDNNWTQNDATRVAGFNQTSTYQSILFDEDRIEYRSFIAAKGEGSDAPGGVGDLLDSFTVTRYSDGSKRVEEGIVPKETDDPDPVPTGRLRVLKIKLAPRKGNATAVVQVPAAGSLRVGGKITGRGTSAIRTVQRKVTRAGKVTVKLVPTGKATRSLKRQGRVKTKLAFVFRSKSGATRTVNRQVTLKLRR